MTAAIPSARSRQPVFIPAALVLLAALAFSALFAVVNLANYNWLSPLFEREATPTVWGIIQRLYLILPAAALAILKPRQIGLQVAKTFRYMRLLVIMLMVNVTVIAAYLLLSGGTPYSGLSMLFNEVVTVPLVEEVVWRGAVFAAIHFLLARYVPSLSEYARGSLAAVYSGVCFGLLHATNALFGYPITFVALQTLSAVIWGVMYGIARARTGSLYPSIIMHAAMNLTVVLI